MTELRWVLLLCRMPAEPARHRMALWRDLRRAGAVPAAQGAWALPDPASGARLEALYAEARAQEWGEFRADCDKYLAELDKEERIGKYTLAELEEEEQSLDRLRRWYPSGANPRRQRRRRPNRVSA